jgi:hypothetical protein
MKHTIKHTLCTIILLVLAGCATVDTRWQKATLTDTVQSYEAFLKQHPDSDYTALARDKIDSLHWQEATTANTIQGFERYIQLHRDGKYVTKAKDNIDSLYWQEAKRRNSLSGYKDFLQKYPSSVFSTQARDEIRKFAEVVIDFPDKLKSQGGYYNIGGPVWVFRIVFRETNGVDATITQKKMRIHGRDGRVWGDRSYENIYNSEPRHQGVVKVNVPAKGTGSYTSWVNSPNCDLCGGTMYLDYNGIDANGHSINVSKQFVLER